MYQLVTRDALLQLLACDQPPQLLEALPRKYYDAGHLPGALHFPPDQLDALAPALLPDPARPVVVYCASQTCNNSHIAAQRLVQLGYRDVRVYSYGKQDWADAGLPLVREPAAAEAI